MLRLYLREGYYILVPDLLSDVYDSVVASTILVDCFAQQDTGRLRIHRLL